MENKTGSGTLFLLDAYALIFRAYYAFINSRMTNAAGLNTSAIYGFTAALEDVMRTQKPSHIAVVFDPPGGTFRNKLYAAYKANRDETPEPIKVAVPWIKKIIKAWNIPVIEVPGFEADDVIGTLARLAEEKGFLTYMMTPDKDYTQLVSPRRLIFKPGRSGAEAEILGVEEVKQRFGIEDPAQVIDILALWGDSSDNVPGAPGIGEKGALKLISEYKSLDNLYANLSGLKEKTRDILVNHRDQIMLSRTLVTIDQYVPVELNEEELEINNYNIQEIIDLYNELGFKSLVGRIQRSGSTALEDSAVKTSRSAVPAAKTAQEPIKTPAQPSLFGFTESAPEQPAARVLKTIGEVSHQYYLINNEEGCLDLIRKLSAVSSFCFDTETSSLDVHTAEMVGISFAIKPFEAWFVHLTGNQELLQLFKPVLENPAIAKTGQNLKFDISVLKMQGIEVQGKLFDTMLAHYLLQPEERHNMDYLAEKFLQYKPVPITDLIGEKGRSQKTMKQVAADKLTEYAAEDADVTLQLALRLQPLIDSAGLKELMDKIEMPLALVLADMECTGVTIDRNALDEYARLLTQELIKLEENIFLQAGTSFNISSPRQLGEILFDKLKIAPDAKKTKTKQYSTSEDVLADLSQAHPIVPLILDFRSCKKLLSTYVEALPALVNPKTGKLHTSYNQAVVATGRLSSTNPNLQNIPIREERGREIRKAFIPSDPEGCLLSADYSQIELRLMAHMSGDENMIQAFQNKEDIHTSTAAKIHSIRTEEVTREMRSQAKTANFGIIYGISGFGLAQRLGISRKEAEDLIQGYFRSFPGVRKYMNDCIMDARDKGYVETLLGRRRYLPEITSGNSNIRGMAERNAINAPIQGTAADIIKIAMINIFRKFNDLQLQSKMILQVHDELVFDVFHGELPEVQRIVKTEMEAAYPLKVELTVDMGTGKNWLEAH
ncbi:MAG: DNA polymerase I [Bacteroidales bacterium]